MLLVGAGLSDRGVCDLPGLLRPNDILVSNDTRVIPARLIGKRGEAKVEVTLHRAVEPTLWRAFARPAKKCRSGDILNFNGLSSDVVENIGGGEVELRFNTTPENMMAALSTAGIMPLPPYIAGQRAVDEKDLSDYQTIFAAKDGAVAAPTAGLHFTPELLAGIDATGAKRVSVTLHVGAGTFLPVKVEKTDDHRMHSEWGEITSEIADVINAARAAGGRVISVGTTSLRLLESATDEQGIVRPFAAETDIFITPGYRFRAVDALLTNFHLPKSTLFMLVSAFMGLERMQSAYAHAIETGYRFYSYGDACFLEPSQ